MAFEFPPAAGPATGGRPDARHDLIGMAATRGTVLVIDDERDLVELLRHNLERAGYDVLSALDGESGLALARDRRPDLILLDLMLPGIDGFEVCRALRDNYYTLHIPVIMLTALDQKEDRIRGITQGADDYVTKPFDLRELMVRVESLARRAASGLDANPLTRLPGNRAIRERIQTLIDDGTPFAALYADIERFKAYNDRFGYAAGDRLISRTADILARTLDASGGCVRFAGHVGGDDFVALCEPDWADWVSRRVLAQYDAGGSAGTRVLPPDAPRRASIPSLTLVGIVDRDRRYASPQAVAQDLAMLKERARREPRESRFLLVEAGGRPEAT